jgi:hypothetical protein
MMKKNFLYKTVILSGLLMAFSCSQDPIFFQVSTETIPEKPRIPGAPTRIVVFNREYPDPDNGGMKTVPIMYVASGRLHWYAKIKKESDAETPETETPEWVSKWDLDEYPIPQPKGKIIDLAVTEDYLYALSIPSSGVATTLWRIGHSENEWTEILTEEKTYTLIQAIYTDEETGKLFAGARNNKGPDFGILYLVDTTLELLPVKDDTGKTVNTEMLSGAASLGDYYYLSTRGKGVYKVAKTAILAGPVETDVAHLTDLEYPDDDKKINRTFMGMIKFKVNDKDAIIVVERNGGAFFEVQSGGFQRIKYNKINADDKDEFVSTGRFATGALAVWNEVNYEKDVGFTEGTGIMLIAGIQGGLYTTTTSTSYTHGYTEFVLKQDTDGFDQATDGWLFLNSNTRRNNNNSPDLTVGHNKDLYSATIGKHPINHMYQVPKEIDDNMIFFASTQTGGLWSYRERSDGVQWNAEK